MSVQARSEFVGPPPSCFQLGTAEVIHITSWLP